MQNFLPLPDGRAFCAGPTPADTLAAVQRLSPADATRLPDYSAMIERVVAYLRSLLLATPPADLRRPRDLWAMLSMGSELKRLPSSTQREVHELFTRSAGEPVSISGMTAFVSQVEFENGKIWVPARESLRNLQLLRVLAPSTQEQWLIDLYRTKALNALVEELNKF